MKKSHHFVSFDEFSKKKHNQRKPSVPLTQQNYLDHDYIRVQKELKNYDRYLKLRRVESEMTLQPIKIEESKPKPKDGCFRSFFSCLFSESN